MRVSDYATNRPAVMSVAHGWAEQQHSQGALVSRSKKSSQIMNKRPSSTTRYYCDYRAIIKIYPTPDAFTKGNGSPTSCSVHASYTRFQKMPGNCGTQQNTNTRRRNTSNATCQWENKLLDRKGLVHSRRASTKKLNSQLRIRYGTESIHWLIDWWARACIRRLTGWPG